MRKALVTLAVGERCQAPWLRFLRPSWLQWCRQHGYELIVFDQALDTSERAGRRSMAWQKLLAMSSPELKEFDRAFWLDADVVINPHAPDPLHESQINKLQMVRDGGSPLSYEPKWFQRCWSHVLLTSLQRNHPDDIHDLSRFSKETFSYYDLWGINPNRKVLYNTGFVGFTPQYHSTLFRSIYDRWGDGGPGALHEMIPLNLELIQLNLIQELSIKYNQLAGVHHAVWNLFPQEVQDMHGFGSSNLTPHQLIEGLFAESYFLHFAGAQQLMLKFLQAMHGDRIWQN